MFVGADTVAEWTTASFGTLLFTIILGVAMVFGRLIIIHRQRFDLVSFTPPMMTKIFDLSGGGGELMNYNI